MSGLFDNSAKTGLSYNKLNPDFNRSSRQSKTLAGRWDIEMGVAFIEQSFDIQLERLQLMVDGATLAAEQVQDKRLEVLESSKEVTIKDVLFDLAAAYFWEVGVIGSILKPVIQQVTKSICTQLLKTRMVYNYLPKSEYGYQIIGMARREKDSAKIIHDIIGEHIGSKNFSSKDYAMFSQEVVDFINNNKASDKAMGATQKAIDIYKQLQQSGALDHADTPGVAMLKAAQSYSGRHRMFLLMQRAQVTSLLRAQQSLPIEDLNKFLEIFEWGQLPNPDFLRDQYKLVFEIMIWAQLYGFKKNSPNSPHASAIDGSITGVSDKTVNYWYERFKPLLNQYERFGSGPFDQFHRIVKSQKVKAYFEDTIAGLQDLSQVTGSIDKLFKVKNKVY